VFITIITDGYMNIKYQSSYDWLEKRVTQGGGGGGEHNKQDKRGGGR
jgi:hypothetical protein